jgi:hypothetical protein
MDDKEKECLCDEIGISEMKNNLPEVEWPSLTPKQRRQKQKNDPTSTKGVFFHLLKILIHFFLYCSLN